MRVEFLGGPLDGDWGDVNPHATRYVMPANTEGLPVPTWKQLVLAARVEPAFHHVYVRKGRGPFRYDGMEKL